MATRDYREVSHDLWQRMSEGWDRDRRWIAEATHPVSEWMLDALQPQPGETILELAAGAGDLGFAAAALLGDGRLISTDFAEAMVEAARVEADRLGLANVETRVMDAEDMDLDGDSVDGVLCRWGYMLMSDPAAALRETRRVLRPGGRLVFSVFEAIEDNPWGHLPTRLVNELSGQTTEPTAPGIFAMSDQVRTRALLADAGFEPKRIERVDFRWRFADFDAYWRFLNELAGAIAIRIAALDDDAQSALRERLEPDVEAFRTADGYELPGVVQNTLAT